MAAPTRTSITTIYNDLLEELEVHIPTRQVKHGGKVSAADAKNYETAMHTALNAVLGEYDKIWSRGSVA